VAIKTGKGVSWLKRGAEAHKAIDKIKADADRRKEAAGKGRRFRMKKGDETQITFLDGSLLPDNRLDAPTFWEHERWPQGSSFPEYFVCVKEFEACPVCDDVDRERQANPNGKGEKGSSLVHAFTIVDHTTWSDKNGKEHAHQKSLFICKGMVFERLQKIAQKRGGLTGCTFDVSREGDMSARVGSDFDFVEKLDLTDAKMCKAQAKAWGLEDLKPTDYDTVFEFRDAKELRKLGFGSGMAKPVGAADSKAVMAEAADEL